MGTGPLLPTPPRPRRGPGLAPMIDVVFLLLIFFLVAARIGADGARPLDRAGAGDGPAWRGPPRLLEVAPGGWRLNGAPVSEAGLAAALGPLLPALDAPVLVRAAPGAPVQALVDALDALAAEDLGRPVLVE